MRAPITPSANWTGYTASDKGTPVYSVAVTRDNLGRIATKSETIGGKTTNYTYNYDASGRLTSVLQNGLIARSYTYDSNSNRLTATAGTALHFNFKQAPHRHPECGSGY